MPLMKCCLTWHLPRHTQLPIPCTSWAATVPACKASSIAGHHEPTSFKQTKSSVNRGKHPEGMKIPFLTVGQMYWEPPARLLRLSRGGALGSRCHGICRWVTPSGTKQYSCCVVQNADVVSLGVLWGFLISACPM